MRRMSRILPSALVGSFWCMTALKGAEAAFTGPPAVKRRESNALRMVDVNSLLSKLPFGSDKQEEVIVPTAPVMPTIVPDFQPTPDGLITRARVMLASDLGVQEESLLDEKFVWVGPNLGSFVLGKRDYLAAGKFFNLRATFPDLDYRAHDYRIDEADPWTVRVTCRTVGTMRGELRLRNKVLPPNGKQIQCPPEAISMTFNPGTGKIVKLCSGFPMDRLVGNTGGLCGVMGAATLAGDPPSDWEIFPTTTVVKRFFGRPVTQLPEPGSFLAPFPETVMIQLAKGILSADMAAADPDLLANSFTFCGQYEGPLSKQDYIENIASELFDGIDPEVSHMRVDLYDPYRVWMDVRPEGVTRSGVSVNGPPQAMSFTFDDDGFCTRMTAGVIMDPSIGNTGGLGGLEGIRYAAGKALPGIASRPLPQVLGRLRKNVYSPFTKISVDEYILEKSEVPRPPASIPTPNMVPEMKIDTISPKPATPLEKAVASAKVAPKPVPPKPSTPAKKAKSIEKVGEPTDVRPKNPTIPLFFEKVPSEPATAGTSPKPDPVAAQKAKAEERAKAVKEAKEAAAAAAEKKREELAMAAKARAQELEKRKAEAAAAAEKKREMAAAAARARASEQEERKAQAAAAAEKRLEEARKKQQARAKTEAEKKAKAAADKKPKQSSPNPFSLSRPTISLPFPDKSKISKPQQQEKKVKAAAVKEPPKTSPNPFSLSRPTISLPFPDKSKIPKPQPEETKEKKETKPSQSLFGSFFSSRASAPSPSAASTKKAPDKKAPVSTIKRVKTAPRGVPTLERWRQNRDGSVTGFIQGSPSFEDGTRVTTSTIAKGDFESGVVVQTESGSKYFLG